MPGRKGGAGFQDREDVHQTWVTTLLLEYLAHTIFLAEGFVGAEALDL